jgi:hypothetical protein
MSDKLSRRQIQALELMEAGGWVHHAPHGEWYLARPWGLQSGWTSTIKSLITKGFMVNTIGARWDIGYGGRAALAAAKEAKR